MTTLSGWALESGTLPPVSHFYQWPVRSSICRFGRILATDTELLPTVPATNACSICLYAVAEWVACDTARHDPGACAVCLAKAEAVRRGPQQQLLGFAHQICSVRDAADEAIRVVFLLIAGLRVGEDRLRALGVLLALANAIQLLELSTSPRKFGGLTG